LSNISKQLKSQDVEVAKKARMLLPILEKLKIALGEGKSARSSGLDEEEIELVKELNLITLKKVLYVCNIDEESITKENEYVKTVREYAKRDGAEALAICGKLEAEISNLETSEEKKEFMDAAGITESGLDQLTHSAYKLLGLRTYFTAGEKEVRAWTFHEGTKAPQAAGIIHSDFERGFIRAEVYHCDDLFSLGSEAKVKEAGKLRVEGKEYVLKDGDIMHFRFNV
jgi:GTP-binding protein YchF